MKKLSFLLLTFSLLFSISSFSQSENTDSWSCRTDSIYNELIRKNPQILVTRNQLNEFVKDYIKNNSAKSNDEIYIIPVVFHVVHEYGSEYLPYSEFERAIEIMNNDYRKMRADTASIVEEFKGIAADAKIEFRLAKIDPEGNCTMGVTRTFSSTTNGGGEDVKDAAPAWPYSKYLNVWTVNSLGGGVAGWSYYPGTAPDGRDGIILLYNYIDVALTHEAGHWLNLPHPWGNSNEPGLASNCEIDDGIDDTPNTIGHTSCQLSAVTCGSLDNVQNFMDYSYCYRMFTRGQANVMRATLNSNISDRNNLSTEENKNATGTNDDYAGAVCIPIADFRSDKIMLCEGESISYNDYTYNTNQIDSRYWFFNGGDPLESDEENPEVQYNESGIYSASLRVENEAGENEKLRENYIRVYKKESAYSVPYVESFESSTFPKITGNSENDFYVENGTLDSWKISPLGYSGKCVKIINSRVINSKNKLYMPNLFIENDEARDLYISMKIACARRSETNSDILNFYYSNSCGENLRLGHIHMGSTLTSVYTNQVANYIPDAEDWKTHTFKVPASKLNDNNFRLVIESQKNGGNTIYIDEVTYSFEPMSVEDESLSDISVYPNPFSNNLIVDIPIEMPEYEVQVFDLFGKMLFSIKSKERSLDISKTFENNPNGIYLLKISDKNKCKTIKLIKE